MAKGSTKTPDAPLEDQLAELVEELTEQLRQGKRPDLAALQDQHPEFASELRSLWPAILIAEELARGTPQPETLIELGARVAPETMSLPRVFGDYELLEELGRGGMGVVYRARQISLGRMVAVKMILHGNLASASELIRFRAEAKAAARLDHPHIVPVYEIGECDGRPYFSMKYIDGPTLADLVARNPLPPQRAASYVCKVAEAVHHAHQQGLLHRDLKPSNVLIDHDDEPHVTDFGLAKRVPSAFGDGSGGESDSGPPPGHPTLPHVLTQTGMIMGTPSYMPPEQAAGARGSLCPGSDVYSLGAILYHLLTGRPPFQAASPLDIILQVREQDPLPPRLLNPQIPRDLEMICLKCLQKPIELRYQTADELARDLQAFLSGESISIQAGSIKELMSRVLRPTHHAAVLENWGTLWMVHSGKVFLMCVLTAWLAWVGVASRIPYLLLWGVGMLAWCWIFWSLRKRDGPVTFVERQIAHVWGGSVLASIALFLVEMALELPVLTLSPVLALFAGMVCMTKAGTLSGTFYVAAAACFLTSGTMAAVQYLYPEHGISVGIVLFGLVVATTFFVPGLKYYRLRSGRR